MVCGVMKPVELKAKKTPRSGSILNFGTVDEW
jgi:hypothetical protein